MPPYNLSYFGNWCPKPEKPIIPCQRQLLGRGPIQDCTTQKCDFTWKCGGPEAPFRPEGNLECSPAPLESCTTNRLSYQPNCQECVLQNKSYKPVRVYAPSTEPMNLDTTMQLSYQRNEVEPIEKPKKPEYHKPTTSLDDNTTYGLSFIPPGKLVPCCPGDPCNPCNVKDPCCPTPKSRCPVDPCDPCNVQDSCCPPPPKSCSTSVCPQASTADTRPCISC